jgi:hypothetical protein
MRSWPRRYRAVVMGTVLGAALMGLALMAPSVWAEPDDMAVIETRAPLEDESDGSINAALKKALEKAIRGAAAMGLGQVEVSGAYRGPSYVVVQILATTPLEEGARGGGPGPGRWSGLRLGDASSPDRLRHVDTARVSAREDSNGTTFDE